MLWDHVAETWHFLSNKVWISTDEDAHAHVRRQLANMGAAESREENYAASGDQKQPNPTLRRHNEADQSHTNSLHMSS